MITDIAIIGSGPNGIFALQKAKETLPFLKTICFDKGKSLNNLRNLPDVRWHSRMKELMLGLELDKKIDPLFIPKTNELIRYYEFFINSNNLLIKENYELTDIKKKIEQDLYELTFKFNSSIVKVYSKYILLATGIFENKRKLSHKFENINYDFGFYNNLRIGLIGAGNSAYDFIINNLPNNKIFWIIRGDSLNDVDSTIKEELNQIINKNKKNLEIYFNTTLRHYNQGEIILSNGESINDINNITALIGFNSKSKLYQKINLKFEKESIYSDKNYTTSLKNVFLIGSINSRWNISRNSVEPTFIHNGNPIKTMTVLQHIKNKVLSDTFPEMKSNNSKKFKWIKR